MGLVQSFLQALLLGCRILLQGGKGLRLVIKALAEVVDLSLALSHCFLEISLGLLCLLTEHGDLFLVTLLCN